MHKGVSWFLPVVIVVALAVASVSYFYQAQPPVASLESSQKAEAVQQPAEAPQAQETEQPAAQSVEKTQPAPEERPQEQVTWDYNNGAWYYTGTPPDCGDLTLDPPADLSKATGIIYPGQYRGSEYKPHGGLRFDDKTNKVDVRSPSSGYVWRGARYIGYGQVQYTFDIVNECGIVYRLGHLLELSPKFQVLVDEMPQPVEGDSRTTNLQPFDWVEKDELIATQVGFKDNVFFDFGVYDVRNENEASKDPAYRQEHGDWKELAFNAVCWIDWLREPDQKTVRSLPTGVEGTQSDYC